MYSIIFLEVDIHDSLKVIYYCFTFLNLIKMESYCMNHLLLLFSLNFMVLRLTMLPHAACSVNLIAVGVLFQCYITVDLAICCWWTFRLLSIFSITQWIFLCLFPCYIYENFLFPVPRNRLPGVWGKLQLF